MCSVVTFLNVFILISSGLFLAPKFSSCQFLSNESQTMDASDITWAHAVNNRQYLEEQLSSSVNFLEADISMGRISGNPIGIVFPIMAHPPAIESDISFESWLDIVIARSTGKGIKLDFKTLDAVESSLEILQKHGKKINFPLWLNADILPGPVDSITIPVNASIFLKICKTYFPNSTLSVGWTTTWYPSIPPDTWRYTWYHVKSMADTLLCSGIEPDGKTKLTFPVRAMFLIGSISEFTWLLEVFNDSSLTVWSGTSDVINLGDLSRIRKSFDISRVYYDIPEPLGTEFQRVKNTLPNYTDSGAAENKWWIMSHRNTESKPCFPAIYATKSSLFFSKGQEGVTLLKGTFDISKGSHFKMKGIVKFVEDKGIVTPSLPSTASNDLVLAIADISLFKKDTVPFANNTDDTDVVRETLNSSPLYKFRRDTSLDVANTSAYFFKLDTSNEEEMFQVYVLLNWYMLLDDPLNEEKLIKTGKPLIDKNKRLVLPSGPIMLGFISSGKENIVVYNLSTEGVIAGLPRTSSGTKPAYTIAFATIIIFITFILLS